MLRHEVRVHLWVERQREANDHYLRGLFAEFLRRHRCGRRRRHHPMRSVRVPDGVGANGIGLKVWGAPTFAKGERAILFRGLSPDSLKATK